MTKTCLVPDFALVTSRGIRFQYVYYSCSMAIREQWFEYARRYGSWKVKIYFNPQNTSVIYLENEGEFEEKALPIQNDMFKGSKLEKYFSSIQYLKRERKSREGIRNY
ncbi:MAG: hypothetical protein ACQEXQ_10125 [Bacillota bacterium]